MRRDSLFWGAVLVLLGGLMFLNAAGIRLPAGINPMQLFWPTLLILLGGWIIFGVFVRGGSREEEQLSIDLQGASQASLKMNHGAGRLVVSAGASPGQLLSGTFAGGVNHKAHRSGDRLDAHVEARPFVFPFFNAWEGLEWNVELNRDVPLSLKLETGASKTELDLRDLRVTKLKLNTGASSTEITLPANAGSTEVDVELGAASVDIVVPQGVAARIRAQHGAAAIDIDTVRFPYTNGIYESADFSSAHNRADIKVQAGAGKVSVR